MRYSDVIFVCKGGENWRRDLLVQELADIGFDTFEPLNEGFVGYIASAQLDLQALDAVLIHQPVGFEVSYTYKEIAPRNWNELWERNFEPVVIADQCYVRATFHTPQPDYPYEIVIDPKMAFGTGHHQTTSLMMRYMLETVFEGKNVLDMGCGTGILAILAAKRGASHIVAIDNDPVCIASVEENTILNHVENVVAICGTADLLNTMKFDIILANINRNILLDQLEDYAQCLETGGELYLSGFYKGDDLAVLKEVGAKYTLNYEGYKELEGWAAARFTKIE